MNKIELTKEVFEKFSCNTTEKVNIEYFPFNSFTILFPLINGNRKEVIEGICKTIGKPYFMMNKSELQLIDDFMEKHGTAQYGEIVVNIDKSKMDVKHYVDKTLLVNFYTDGINIHYEDDQKCLKAIGENNIKSAIAVCLNTIYSTVAYITSPLTQEAKKDIERIKRSYEPQQQQTPQIQQRSKKYIYRTVYKISDININENKIAYTKSIDIWEVRGHWRTLKTGKKTWVKPYKKGTGIAQHDKQYKITQTNK